MTNDERDVVFRLLKAFGRTRNNLMAANMAIKAFGLMSPQERAQWDDQRIKRELENARLQLAQQPDAAFVQIQLIVSRGDAEVVTELRKFVDGLQW